jgi:prepilin-type N-terminal cleavage/methylation domain-containing protein
MQTRTANRRLKRDAFTLMELLVVTVIILILVGLTTAAVMAIWINAGNVVPTTEIRKFELAIENARMDLGRGTPLDSLPSFLILREDGNYFDNTGAVAQRYQSTVAALQKAFGRACIGTAVNPVQIDWNGNGAFDGSNAAGFGPEWILEGEHCLVFWLGGIPAQGAIRCTGFSTNQSNPAAQGGTRKGPYYPDFLSTRLSPDPTSGFYTYLDSFVELVDQAGVHHLPQPYAYFCSRGSNNYSSDCPSLGVNPYFDGTVAAPRFMNPNSFQIICAGKDNIFGPGGNTGWSSATGYGTGGGAGMDDIANFSKAKLAFPVN